MNLNLDKNRLMVISFALSIGFWWYITGSIDQAVGVLVLIFIHEMGHYLAAKVKNLRVSPPIFMGPLGAFISMEEQPASARDEADMAFAGPLLGTIGGVITVALGVVLGVPALIGLAGWAFWLNLFNLIPLAPLDGGRISMAIDRRMWVLGLPMILWLLMSGPSNTYGTVVMVLILFNAWQDIQQRKLMQINYPQYFDVGFKTRIGYAVAYLALGAFLYWTVSNPMGLVRLLIGLGL